MKMNTERKKIKMKKSVRITIAGVLAATSLAVACIPTKGVQAEGPFDPATMVPTDLDTALAQEQFVASTTVHSNAVVASGDLSKRFWAFPLSGEPVVIYEGANEHKYYKIDRTGMDAQSDAIPIFEIADTTTPSSGGVSNCIRSYVGGQTSGYYPAGDKLQLSTAVIYCNPAAETEATWLKTSGGDPAGHTPFVWERYVEKRIVRTKTPDMIRVYGTADNTPDCFYYNVIKYTWTRPWIHTEADEEHGIPESWTPPTDPVSGGEQPDSEELFLKEVCKQYQLVGTIGNEAFKNVANFSSMEILSGENNSGINQIGDSAFENCVSLRSISFGPNFQKIGSKAFHNCTELRAIDFNKTSSIGDGAFADCTALATLALPTTLQQLGTAAFMNCRSLTDYIPALPSMDAYNPSLKDHNSRIFGGSDTDVGINRNDFTVGSYAFANCTSLVGTKMCQTSPPIDGTIGQYGMYAGCTKLEFIELPRFMDNFKTTSSMFLGCNKLACVHAENFTGTAKENGYFVNTINDDLFAPKPHNVSDDFVLWGPNPNESSSIAIFNYAQENSLPYMYYDTVDGKFKYIMVIDKTYKFTFTDDFVIESIIELADVPDPATTITIPASIGGHPIQAIADNCTSVLQGSTYVSTLQHPTTIRIADSIATIGANAFRSCKSLKEVNFIHIPETVSAGRTSIGASCFEDCNQLEKVNFRDDNFRGDGYYDINIDETSVGPRAFLTQNPNGLTLCGKMEQGYWPYEYAINPENIVCSTKADSYITYESGNPYNLTARYSRPNSAEPGYVSLLSYPTVNTVVGTEKVENPAGSGHYIDQDITIYDLILRYTTDPSTLSPNQERIINTNTKSIYVPYGITSILNAKNDLGTQSSPDTSDNAYFIGVNDYKTGHNYGLTTLTFESLESLPSVDKPDRDGKPFAECQTLTTINFNGNMKNLGVLPFYNIASDLVTAPLSALKEINFNGENDKATATIDDPYYWYDNGIIYAYYVDGNGVPVTLLVEVLGSRGMPGGIGTALINEENDPCLADVTEIAKDAFMNCDYITSVDFTSATGLNTIPEDCFYNCNQLKYVTLPANVKQIRPRAFQEEPNLKDIYIEGNPYIDGEAFKNTNSTVFHARKESNIGDYVDMVNRNERRPSSDKLIYEEMTEEKTYTIIFIDGIDYSEFDRQTVPEGWNVALPTAPSHVNYTFLEYYSNPANAWVNVRQNATVYAKYTPISTSGSSSSSTSTTKPSSTGGGNTGGGGTGSRTTSSSNASSRSTSITSTTVQPVIVSGTGTFVGAGGTAAGSTPAAVPVNTGSGSSTPANNQTGNIGKTKLISTTDGISDTSKMSATVSGSSDNYVIKITETAEANEMAEKALTAAFGSLDAIRYLPMDISLYDSTGSNKISPIPAGVSINITMPIPDDLAIYGGNAKVGLTEGGVLTKIQPRFTVINGVPCMNFTVTHLSPYVVYVDTANLTATGTLDATPKTGDPIHPKWFLVIGLAAISGVLFLKKDRKETAEAA